MEPYNTDLPPRFDVNEDNDIPVIPCTYKNLGNFGNTVTNCMPGTFSMMMYNIRSCRKNFGTFLTFLCNLKVKLSFIVLVETWLIADTDHAFHIDGYKQVNIYRDNLGGGIKFFYNELLDVEIIDRLTFVNNVMEVLTLYLIGSNFRYVICCIYRSTRADPFLFDELFFEQVVSGFPADSKIIITGDINLNLFNPLKLTYVDSLVANMLGFGFFPIITIPTKINENCPITPYSLIDQVWTNFKVGENHDSGVIMFSLTDHFPVYYSFVANCSNILKTIQFRLVNDNTKSCFVNLVESMDFSEVFESRQLNVAFDIFSEKLFETYNSAFPIKRKRIKSNLINAPWVTPRLKRCIKKKFVLFNLLRRGLIQRQQFNRYKNALTWVINKIRRQYHLDTFRNCSGNFRKMWYNINSLLNRRTQDVIRKIITDDGHELGDIAMANYFNDFFTNVVSRLTENMANEIDFDYFNNIQAIGKSCYFMPTTEHEVKEILSNMPNKGNSLLDIKPRILLLVSNVVTPIIAYLYNLGITCGLYPDVLKMGRVVPTFKSGEMTKVNNYRPITILSTLNKIFEILTCKRMRSFIGRHKIISDLQFGFSEGKSTTQAIFKVVTDILETFHNKTYTAALFLDLTKAFDTVNKDILMHKMGIYGFRGIPNSFLSSYMSNRFQFVYIEGRKSEVKPVSTGVPQGSVLGPLLFNLFINDIVNVGRAEKVLFADDAVFYVTAPTLQLCIEKLNSLITELSFWLENNRLIPNVIKTKVMMFTPRHTGILPEVFFNGTRVEWVNDFRYLGIIIDNKLNFTLQTREVYKRVSKMQGVVYSLSSLLPRQALLTIYYSLVYSLVSQNIVIWGSVPEVNVKNIKICLNKILRSILKVEYDENNIPLVPTNEMYKSLNLLKFEDIYKYFLLKFVHLVLYGKNDMFDKHLLPLMPRHRYNTRNSRINLPDVRLQIEKQSTVFQMCKLINELPNYLLTPQSKCSLKRQFKNYAISYY